MAINVRVDCELTLCSSVHFNLTIFFFFRTLICFSTSCDAFEFRMRFVAALQLCHNNLS